MKSILLLPVFFIILFCKINLGQVPNVDWVNIIGGSSIDFSSCIISDSNGNIISIGAFKDTVDFDPSISTVEDLISISGHNIYIQKIDLSGNLVWVKQLIKKGFDFGSSITIDNFDNLYSTGNFIDTIDMDADSGIFNIIGPGAFIQKLNSNGEFIWAKKIEGNSTFIKSDGGSGLFITGYFTGTKDFDPGSQNYNLTASGNGQDIFILKLDSAGNFQWVKQIGNNGNLNFQRGNSIALDSSGNVFLAGTLSSNSFGNFIYIQKFDPHGNTLWAHQFGGSNVNGVFEGKSISTDIVGNVYVTGRFGSPFGPIDFDPGVNINALTATDIGVFILKLRNNGDFVWVKKITDTGDNVGRCITIDKMQNILVTGHFEYSQDFDPDSNVFMLNSNGYKDVFVLKLDSSANFLWAISLGSSSSSFPDNGQSITINNSNEVITTGAFYFTADFDPGSSVNNITSNGESDIYIIKFSGIVGINELQKQDLLKVFPNPSSGIFTIIFDKVFENIHLEIYNELDQIVYSKFYGELFEPIILDINRNGMYFIKSFYNNQIINSKKLIILNR